MLVILTENQVLSPDVVCQGCLLADEAGHPRWNKGRLRCGHVIHARLNDSSAPYNTACKAEHSELNPQYPSPQYQCQMGFRVTDIS